MGFSHPRHPVLIWLIAALLTTWRPDTAEAQEKVEVSIELVFAVDTSLSVDTVEYNLQMAGMAAAFRSPQIIALIGQHPGGVAVSLFQWNSKIDSRHVIGWQVLQTPASILAFAAQIEQATRDPVRGYTALGRAIEHGVRMITSNRFAGRQRKIDISGDGRSNTGLLPQSARHLADAHGIVVNGLPILIDTYNLHTYFQEKVITGPGAFIEIATDYRDFARAFLRKLARELSPMTADAGQAQTLEVAGR